MSKRAQLLENEAKIRALWQETKVFEANLPSNRNKDKYFCTFPFPYMNGRLHIGHAFSVSKAEFQARFQRTQGKAVLWPFGLHCTGMPIMACADKIKNELHESSIGLMNNHKNMANYVHENEESNVKDVTKFTSSRSKLKAKSGTNMTQMEIMKQMNISDEDIPKFADPDHWLTYFSPLAIQDMKLLGLSVDWRRSFITTARNPYFNLFVEWQFDRLKKLNKLLYGCRPSILSRITMQPCADHDRSEGEGATAQEYTVVKMKLDTTHKNPFTNFTPEFENSKEKLLQKNVYLLAATLRPETFYGQTNLFVIPEGEYESFLGYESPKLNFNSVGVVENKLSLNKAVEESECIYVTSRRSATNLIHQGLVMLNETDELYSVHKFKGMELIGLTVITPLSVYKSVHIVPMLTANMNKGTGIVACVPSDSPDDYVVLSELRRKINYFNEKYNVAPEYLKCDPFPIIDVPDYGTCMAEKLCTENNVTSSKDVKLEQLKELIYKKGFYTGIITYGKYKNQKVVDVKNKIRDELIENKEAFVYYEPSKRVVSRLGDECVVGICNQWYTKFGDKQWKENILNFVTSNQFTCYNESTYNQLLNIIQWLDNWACSRSYGLGTLLPWENIKNNKNILIESLSDSTIYMAYYTVAHYLQSDIFGTNPGLLNLSSKQINYSLFDYIFRISDNLPSLTHTGQGNLENHRDDVMDKINRMREEFNYWYPVNVRCSGKDLLFNHLTMSLFIHNAIWESNDYMPRSYFCNGHVLVNSEKMSKSKGNFLTIEESINQYTADGTRIALADAGDTLDDANFSKDTAESSILKLYNFLQTTIQDLSISNTESCVVDGTNNTGVNHHLDDVVLGINMLELDTKTTKPSIMVDELEYINKLIELGDLYLFSKVVFENELKYLTDMAKKAYENFIYRDALKFVFYDYITVRLDYIQLSNNNINHQTLQNYYRIFCIIANPIIPYICEYIWNYILKEKEPLSHQLWPQFKYPTNGNLHILLKLLYRNIEEFRKIKDKSLSGKQKNKSTNETVYTKAKIYISVDYPENIRNVLSLMNNMNILENNLSEKEVLKLLNEDESVRKLDKKEKNSILSFASYQLKQLNLLGNTTFQLRLPYDEFKLYTLLVPYLKLTLSLQEVLVLYEAEGMSEMKQLSLPGRPSILFY
ncbi:leucine--tRNA ligase [Theileria parva strain Muguga]|uniref:leucine--tRNA ligase n=1 Tax=Theileria parva TaxID=5875 RepID=Q4N1Y5_THEPA|nr:leucine--tRNA ligase [Theileria parva strain Muguga]EAN31944.1 leucine--tRNA ligase [Theileria parva strain Muguga]|eukprot:XP_764227.1 leucyl-tRNA synthetase [Theileria parva strain Muguga]